DRRHQRLQLFGDPLGSRRGTRFTFGFAAGVTCVGEEQRQRRRRLLVLEVVGQQFVTDVVFFTFFPAFGDRRKVDDRVAPSRVLVARAGNFRIGAAEVRFAAAVR